MVNKLNCRNCGAALTPGADQCQYCGTPVIDTNISSSAETDPTNLNISASDADKKTNIKVLVLVCLFYMAYVFDVIFLLLPHSMDGFMLFIGAIVAFIPAGEFGDYLQSLPAATTRVRLNLFLTLCFVAIPYIAAPYIIHDPTPHAELFNTTSFKFLFLLVFITFLLNQLIFWKRRDLYKHSIYTFSCHSCLVYTSLLYSTVIREKIVRVSICGYGCQIV